MKKYLLLVCLLGLSTLWACDDEEDGGVVVVDPTPSEYLADTVSKTWRVDTIDGTVSVGNTPLLTIDLINPPSNLPFDLPEDASCLADNEITFYANHTFTAYEGTVSCADSLNENASGNWAITLSGTAVPDTLVLSSDENLAFPVATPLPLLELTETRLITSYVYTFSTPVEVPQIGTIENVDVRVTFVHP